MHYEVNVTYKGFNSNYDTALENTATKYGGTREGSGFMFSDGLRDIDFSFGNYDDAFDFSQEVAGDIFTIRITD